MCKQLIQTICRGVLLLVVAVVPLTMHAENQKYENSAEYKMLRDSLFRTFNEGDSARFFRAVKDLQDYLLEQGDLHAYYTQRCNEIVFLLNGQHVFEAYKLALQLSKELSERKLDKEMYMAINMMGHIYRYSGNKESAKRCFHEVLTRMAEAGYTESMPPIYMNLVNIYMEEEPEKALQLIDKAMELAKGVFEDRVFDIETRRTLAYYSLEDWDRFEAGYRAYEEGKKKGLTSVHGRKLEVYHLARHGQVDEAARLALEGDDDPYHTQAEVYQQAGRWKEAYEALKKGAAQTDSINSVILSGSMQGIQQELKYQEQHRASGRRMLYALTAIAGLLLLLVLALLYIVQSRRRHIRQMDRAYKHIVESDQMKTAFIQNVSHEVRTPLNIISGFAQVIADPDYAITDEERKHISHMVMQNTQVVTQMVNEILEMSNVDALTLERNAETRVNKALGEVLARFCHDQNIEHDTIRLASELADDVTCDVEQNVLSRLLTPLLDNAVKNSGGKPVAVRARKEEERLVLTVEDHGQGIPEKEREHIFERFVKLDNFKSGLGLGLTYCRTVARRLGGDVVVDGSYEGPGARFKLTL